MKLKYDISGKCISFLNSSIITKIWGVSGRKLQNSDSIQTELIHRQINPCTNITIELKFEKVQNFRENPHRDDTKNVHHCQSSTINLRTGKRDKFSFLHSVK